MEGTGGTNNSEEDSDVDKRPVPVKVVVTCSEEDRQVQQPLTQTIDQVRAHRRPTESEEQNDQCKTCMNCCKTFTTFLFSNLGLTSLVVGYSILGGFLFMKLESPYERHARISVTNMRNSYAQKLWNTTLTFNILYEENWTSAALTILQEFQAEVIEARKAGWDGAEGEMELQWSFAGSLLYAITVITTIGYGHIAPKTVYGQVVTVVYALFGIPMTLLCLANIGSFLGHCFRLLYKHTCLCLTWLCCPPKQKPPDRGTLRRKQDGDCEEAPLQSKGPHVNTKATDTGDKSVHVSVEDSSKSQKEEVIRVPIFVSVMIIALYIFGGALLFSIWEGWDYWTGSYFCFITLSTIGFGDYVPGSIKGSGDSTSNEKLILCSFYLMFGLSILVMCFNLMQEEVNAKFRWLGMKLGFIDPD